MEKKKRTIIKIISIFATAFIVFIGLGISCEQVSAKKTEFRFSKSKYTVYEGNIISLNLIKDGEENYLDKNDFWWSGGHLSTSDSNVVRIDGYGNLVCVGTGKAVITAYYNKLSAKCTIKVKDNNMKLSSYEETVYSHQEIVIKTSGIKKIVYDDTEWEALDEYFYDTATINDYPISWTDNKGNFHIKVGRRGDFRFRLIVKNNKGQSYSKHLLVHVVEAGPASTNIAVAIGGEVKLEMIDSNILSLKLVNNYSNDEEYDGNSKNCPIESDGAGGFKAKYEGTAIYEMKYEVDEGTVLKTNITVDGYKTDYIPFNDYLWVGSSYYPKFEKSDYNSSIICTSSDTDVVAITEYGSIVPMKAGTVTLTIWIDGLEFKEEVKVIDLNIKDNTVMTWPGQKFSFKISNLPKGSKVKYSSSDENVATINKKGVMRAVGKGFTVVTVTIDGKGHDFFVNVGEEISVKAVLNAAAVVGTAIYSQDKRMDEGYYDCSSLTWRSYALAGLKIKDNTYAPTAADLAKYMEDNGYVLEYGNIPIDEMLPGDFLFYAGSADNGRFMKINHVAMYYATACYESDDYWGMEGEKYGILVEAGSGGVHFSRLNGSDGAVMVARWKFDS